MREKIIVAVIVLIGVAIGGVISIIATMISAWAENERNEILMKQKDIETQREQTTIRLPEELMEELKQEAVKRGLSFNQLVLIVLNKYLNHQK